MNGLEALEKVARQSAGHADRGREHAADGRYHVSQDIAAASAAAVFRFRHW